MLKGGVASLCKVGVEGIDGRWQWQRGEGGQSKCADIPSKGLLQPGRNCGCMSGVCGVVDANVHTTVWKFFKATEEKILERKAEEKVEGGVLYDMSVDREHYTPDPHRQVLNAPECPVFGAACSLHF